MSEANKQPAGAFRTVLNMLLEPKTALTDLRERPSWLTPTLLVAGSTALVLLWYFSILDLPWFLESLFYEGNAEPTQDEIDAFQEGIENVPQMVFIISGFLGAILFLFLIWLLQAGYLTLVSALTGDGFRFSNWFCLVTWTSIPSLLSVIGIAITLLLNPNGQISQTELDPLLLANLGLQSDGPGIINGIGQISLTQLWALGLLVYGYCLWLKGSWLKNALIVLVPQLLIFGALIALSSGGSGVSVSTAGSESGGGSISVSVSL